MPDILIFGMKMPKNEPLRLVLNPNGQLFVRNAGNDFLFDNAESCFFAGADLFLATCNDDGGWKYVTATFWRRIM